MEKYQYKNPLNGQWEDIPADGVRVTEIKTMVGFVLLVEIARTKTVTVYNQGEWRMITENSLPSPPQPGTNKVYVNEDGSNFTLYALTLREKNGTRTIYTDTPMKSAFSDWEDVVKSRPGMKELVRR